ncbi:hypothetical protein JKA74_11645 [Marivirga sp. S37H4]|uniref:Uncharacterized protein n=1 Tax=Marivirga aurantiaca TaxID=2802615 RepID=A0A935C9M7_9BACT|nr:hypothetical protein [Marivirga aurantiaca]MBK6265692.1 hypothetical protein [Marivirga aurantiaca]
MDTKNTFSPPELDKKSTYWISGIGQVQFKGESILIKIILYKLSELIKPSEFKFDMNQIPDWKPIVLWIDVGMISEITIGCFIHKTKILQPKKNLKKLRVTNLGLEDEKGISDFKVKSIYDFRIEDIRKDKNGKIITLPSYGFPFSKLKNLPCLHYINREKCKLYVFPCIEVIRFYFFTSSDLAYLLCGHFLKEHILVNQRLTTTYKNAKYDGSDFIQLSRNVPGEDVLTVGRIYLYEKALRAANMIRNSIFSSYSEGDGGYPKSFFPFDDSSNLEINTIEMGVIKVEGPYKGYSVEFVSKIVNCDYKFIQEGFEWYRDNDNSKADQTNADKRKGPKHEIPPEDTNELNIRRSHQPYNPSKRKKKLNLTSSRFKGAPDLNSLKYNYKTEQKTVTDNGIFQQEDSNEETLNPGISGDSKAGSATIADSPPTKKESDKERKLREDRQSYILFFNQLAERFTEDSNLEISTYSLFFDEKKWGNEPITEKMRKFSTGHKKLNQKKRQPKYVWEGKREVKFIEIQIKSSTRFYYLFDVIQRQGTADPPTLLFLINNSDYKLISKRLFQEIFLFFTNKRKIAVPKDELRHLEWSTFKREFVIRRVDKDAKEDSMEEIKTFKPAEQTYMKIYEVIKNKI